ncbi:MAG: HAD family hydrolase [Nitrososphaerota archaeon]
MRLSGIFADYDGTLAPKNIARKESKLLDGVEDSIGYIREHGKFAVVSTKDYWFLISRLPNVDAIGCIGGIEVVIEDRSWIRRGVVQKLKAISKLLEASIQIITDPDVVFEVKALRNRRVAGLCIDWRYGKAPVERFLKKIGEVARRFRLYVEEYRYEPFLDIFPARPDKGVAVSFIKDVLGIDGPIMYIGDSKTDNPAFKATNISVGVIHNHDAPSLECQYFIKFENVPKLLSELVNLELNFDPSRLPLCRV